MHTSPAGTFGRDPSSTAADFRQDSAPPSSTSVNGCPAESGKPQTPPQPESGTRVFSTLLSRILDKLAFIAPGGGTLRPWLHKLRGVRVGQNVWIAQMVYIDELHPDDVEIGDNCTIGFRSSIFTHFYWGRKRATGSGKVIIERDVFVGPHCVILPKVRIGEGAVIRAGTVVSRNVPPHAIWGLRPAELLGIASVALTPEHSYEEFTRGMRPAPRSRARGNSDVQRR